MCDYSLHAVKSRPAEVGEQLVTTGFRGTMTRGFAAPKYRDVAVCLLPGTELAFDRDITCHHRWFWAKSTGFRVARICAVGLQSPSTHHDAIELPDGRKILLTELPRGQKATVLQLPVQPEEMERRRQSVPISPAAGNEHAPTGWF